MKGQKWTELEFHQFRDRIADVGFDDYGEREFYKIKSVLTRPKSYFTKVDNSNALCLRTIWDPNPPRHIDLYWSPSHNVKIGNIIYATIGQGQSFRIWISKQTDDFYLVMVDEMDRKTGRSNRKYYLVDALDGLIQFLKMRTSKFPTYKPEVAATRADRERKIQRIVNKIRNMDWEAFNRFYDQFM